MRLKDLANEIGITRQELKAELQKTNFGVDINAREITDALAQGIIRFLAPKYKDRKKEMMRKEEAKRKAEELENGGPLETSSEKSTEILLEDADEKDDEKDENEEKIKSGPFVFKVSKQIEKKKKILEEEEKKKEEERKKAEEDRKKEEEERKIKKDKEISAFSSDKPWKNKKGGSVAVTRKIEFTEDEREFVKRKKPSKKGKSQDNTDTQKKAMKRFRANEGEAISEQERLALLAEEQMRRQLEDEEFKASQAKRRSKMMRQKTLEETMVKKEGVVEIGEAITVKEFSEKSGIPASKLISELIKNGVLATMNTNVDYDTWAIIGSDIDVQIKKQEQSYSVEDILEGDLHKLLQDEPENLEERPPVIVVMGHVDHGKTSILDFYRNTHIVDKESGGITQHIGAYQVVKKGKKITFLDTPGHEAFTSMRARGAKITDIAILVVAADEGIKTQTEEAYNHAKEAGVPIIVAINKIDKEGADVDRIKGDLMGLGLVSEDYGGDTMMIPVSAKQGTGMDDLLEAILLQSEILDLKANPNRSAIATIVESHLDKSLGPVATAVINTGTLEVGNAFVVGSLIGKVRIMLNSSGESIKKSLPSGAVFLSGFESVPNTGDIIQVVENEKTARERAQKIALIKEGKEQYGAGGMSEILAKIQSKTMNILKIVVKADANGSIEAIKQMISKIENTEVGVKVIHSAVGEITESDIMMASASQGLVIGFNVKVTPRVKLLAEKEKVEVQIYDVIYNLIDDIKAILTGMLQDEEIEVEKGEALVKAIFMTSKKKQIVGVVVKSGAIVSGARVRIMRGEEVLTITEISNVRSFDKDTKEVLEGNECGVMFAKKMDIEEGDVLQCIIKEKRMKTL